MLSSEFPKNSERLVYSFENFEEFEQLQKANSSCSFIGTHSGTFHADEVLATFLLKFLPEYNKSIIIRTRNYDILDKCDIVVDVGSKFDPKLKRFDHHMKEFFEVFDKNEEKIKDIKLSSAGLVWKYLGKDILIYILKGNNLYEQNKEHLDEIIKKIYLNFICMVDAKDNGINAFPSNIEPKYIDNTGFSSRIARLNPEWNSENVDVNSRFKKAWDLAEDEFYYQLMHFANSYFIAYDIVENSIQKSIENKNYDYIILNQYCPWKEILFEIEKKLKIEGKIKFVLLENQNHEFVVNTVPISLGNFEFRKGIVKSWRGLREKELEEKSGLKQMTFVHASGFICFTKSLETALKVIEKSLNDNE